MANQLKTILPGLISKYQCGGIIGRQIHEEILVANESINAHLKSGKPGLVYKLDLKKAFDTISWSFMYALFHKFGSGPKWRHWLQTCWRTTKFSILVDGIPCGFFHDSRGLRQRDPLSPLLFSLVAESLAKLVLKSQQYDLVRGLAVK